MICHKHLHFKRTALRHVANHSATKKHSCHVCSKGFNDKYDLTRHLRSHTGIRPFVCDQCSKGFSQRISLEKHVRTIHQTALQYNFRQRRTKLYVCEKCGVTNTTKKLHNEHVLTC